MRRSDLIKLAILNLRRRPTRTLLTVIGVAAGTACIILMLSIGYFGYEQFASLLENNDALTRIEVNDFSSAGTGRQGRLTRGALEAIASVPHVVAVSPVITAPATLRTGPYEASQTITGIDPSVLRLNYVWGGVFSSDASMPSLIVGEDAAKSFVDPDNPPDLTDWDAYLQYSPDIDWKSAVLELQIGYPGTTPDVPDSGTYRVGVSGVSKSGQSGAGQIYMDLESLRRILLDNRELAQYMGVPLTYYTQGMVRVDDMENVETVSNEIRRLGLETYSETDYILQMQQEQGQQQLQLLAIGLISLCVAAVGIANTMYASILECRAEIGIMKVVGMKSRLIRGMFIIQAAIIGLIGGLAGLLVSWIVTLGINTGAEGTQLLGTEILQGHPLEIPVWVAAGAVAIAVLVGILSGVYPAWKATRMSPLDAMRET